MSLSSVAAPPAPEASEEEREPRDLSQLIKFGGIGLAVVLVLGALYFLVLKPSGAEEVGGAVTPGKRAAAAGPNGTVAPGQVAAPEQEPAPASRDPFKSIVPVATESGAAAAADTGTAAGTGTTADTGSSTGTDAGTGDGTTGSDTPAADPIALKMERVDTNSVVIKVDGKQYTPIVGDVFGTGGSFRLYGVFSATCAGIQFGDSSIPLCEGDTVTVTP